MRIAIFTDTYHPMMNGVIVSIDNLSENLVKRGHKVEIFTVKIWRKARPPKGIKAHYYKGMILPTHKDVKIATPNTLDIIKKIKKFNPDVIHSETPFGMGAQAFLCSKLMDIPLVYTEHTHLVDFTRYASPKEVEGLKKIELLAKVTLGIQLNLISVYSFYLISTYKSLNSIPKLIERFKTIKRNKKKSKKEAYARKFLWYYMSFFYNHADFLTTPSEAMKKVMKQNGAKPKITVVSNGIDRKLFHKVKVKKPKEFKIIHVGRISWEKNIDVTIKAVAEVIKKYPNTIFEVCGNGPQLKEMRDYVRKHKLQENIKLLGSVKHEELPKHYSSSDLFVTASTIETEGIVLLEAMSCGLPIVAVNKLACPLIVKHEKNGFIAPVGNYKKMAEYIKKFIEDKTLAGKMGEESIKLSREYDLRKVVDKWEKIYAKVVKDYKKEKGDEN